MWSPYFFGASLAATELRLWSWRSTSVEICASKAALCATGSARTAADTNAVHDRLLQSMCVRFSDSEQWSSPVKPPRSQNYVKPHDARTRVHVGKVVEGIAPCRKDRLSWAGPPYDEACEG